MPAARSDEMFYPKSILISCVCVLFSLSFGFPNENAHTSCGTGNSTCAPKTKNVFQAFWNKSLEITFRYKVKLISVAKCKVPSNRMDQSKPVNVVYKIKRVNRETTLMDIEVHTNKKVGPLFISCRGYTVKQNSIRDLIYKIDKVSCSHSMISQFMMILQVKLDKCMIEPGVHALNNINLDSLAGALSPTIVSPGIYAYELEFYHSKGVIACETFNSQVTERRKSKP